MNKILITGIGGNVGYGILKNIRTCYNNVILIGTNTEFVSPGNHLCDHVYKVPFSTDIDYIKVLRTICEKHNVELIIPSTDYETYILANNADQFPTLAVSPSKTSKIFLDKYLTYTTLSSYGIPFAESILPSNYKNQFTDHIIKPREGRGSRNVFINHENPLSFSNEYIVQPLLKGKEITTAFYVTKRNELHGLITFERQLASGATQSCEVTIEYDSFLNSYISQLILKLDIRGSCNIQSIVTENGIIPFEVNCRISGTNSIRSQFGFKDVCYTIEEYLYNNSLEKPSIRMGSAIRILSDIIYPDIKLEEIKNSSDSFYIYG